MQTKTLISSMYTGYRGNSENGRAPLSSESPMIAVLRPCIPRAALPEESFHETIQDTPRYSSLRDRCRRWLGGHRSKPSHQPRHQVFTLSSPPASVIPDLPVRLQEDLAETMSCPIIPMVASRSYALGQPGVLLGTVIISTFTMSSTRISAWGHRPRNDRPHSQNSSSPTGLLVRAHAEELRDLVPTSTREIDRLVGSLDLGTAPSTTIAALLMKIAQSVSAVL
ncbi:hypothetical protein BXZ70DRAFT_9088 [Cristinia sonorae]|uniref:Uncharacterized protein n=1 Tax=Cristinia sonorae TaxID=1940300 RepID=A0A8K0XUU3_9AGAR|nr:hypothetical protein BXZ70DRAFT_9088 [Cristinia sonorae]